MARVSQAWLRCPDGIRLAASLWCPEGPGPWPVLLMRQPYGRAIASTVTYAHPSWYADHGFLVVIQDVRGRGDSEGTFRGFDQEAADGAATVRWARRLEGSDGRVGTYGFSYQGLTQLLNDSVAGVAEADPPDGLPDCLAPAMCGLDERRDWAGEGGAHWWAHGVGWALQLAAEGCRRREDEAGWMEIRRCLGSGAWLQEGPALLERHDPDGMGRRWLGLDPGSEEGWRSHPVAQELLRRPMLLIGGWHDPHLRGVLDLWQRSRAAGGRPELHIGAWTHLDWQGGLDERQLAFFRRHLKETGPENGSAHGPDAHRQAHLQGTSDPAWHSWSTACLRTPRPVTAWGLRSQGLAAVRSDEGRLEPLVPGETGSPRGGSGSGPAGRLRFVHDPWRPVPGRGGHLPPEPGPAERTDLDRRADVACFTAPPLEAGMTLLGEPRLTVVAAADQPGFDLCAALSSVSADGTAVRQLSTGVARILGEEALRASPRQLRLQPLLARLAPGERLRLSLAGAAWPQLAVNPGDGSLPRGGPGPRHRVITISLDLGDSRLWLDPLPGAN